MPGDELANAMTMVDVKNPTTYPHGEMPSPRGLNDVPSDSYDHGSDESADKARYSRSHPADYHEDESRDH